MQFLLLILIMGKGESRDGGNPSIENKFSKGKEKWRMRNTGLMTFDVPGSACKWIPETAQLESLVTGVVSVH